MVDGWWLMDDGWWLLPFYGDILTNNLVVDLWGFMPRLMAIKAPTCWLLASQHAGLSASWGNSNFANKSCDFVQENKKSYNFTTKYTISIKFPLGSKHIVHIVHFVGPKMIPGRGPPKQKGKTFIVRITWFFLIIAASNSSSHHEISLHFHKN